MNPILKNILAVVAGIIGGSIVNMALIMASGYVIPYPEGMIVGDPESLKEFLPQFEFKNFVMPWLAHALGTLVGAYLATKIAANRKLTLAMILGAFFMLGGIMNIQMVGGPVWFSIADIAGAYIPMAWIGYKLAVK